MLPAYVDYIKKTIEMIYTKCLVLCQAHSDEHLINICNNIISNYLFCGWMRIKVINQV